MTLLAISMRHSVITRNGRPPPRPRPRLPLPTARHHPPRSAGPRLSTAQENHHRQRLLLAHALLRGLPHTSLSPPLLACQAPQQRRPRQTHPPCPPPPRLASLDRLGMPNSVE